MASMKAEGTFTEEHEYAAGMAIEIDTRSFWQEIKHNPRLILCCIIANTGSLAFGYDIVTTGAVTALPAFSISFGEAYNGQLILPALWQGLWTAFIQLGIMVGAAACGAFHDRFGRRLAFALGGVLTAVGKLRIGVHLTRCFSASRPSTTLPFSKILVGMGIGILMTTCQTYVSETTPTKIRGVFLGLFPLFVSVGQMIAITLIFTRILIFDPSAFKIPFAIQWVFSLLAIIATFVLPETPTYLLARENRSAAEKACIRLYGTKTNTDLILNKIQIAINHEKAIASKGDSTSFAKCFTASNRRRTLIIALVALLQYFLGVSLLANANYFLIMAGMSPAQSLTISQIGIGLQIIATFVAWFTMTRFGRRTIVLWSSMAAGIVFVAMGIAGFFQHDVAATRFIGAAILIVGTISQLGVGVAWPVLISELSSIQLRAKSSAIGFIVNAFAGVVFSISVPYMFNADAGNLSGKIGLVFAALCFLGVILSFFYLPETKDKSFETLDYLFESRTPTRAFAKAQNIALETSDHNGNRESVQV